MLSSERQSARMSKITNDGLTRSGTECFVAVPMATVGVKGLTVIIPFSALTKIITRNWQCGIHRRPCPAMTVSATVAATGCNW